MKTKSSALLIAVAFGLMAFLPKAHAVVPTPDGCYPNFTTAEGCNALNLLTTGAGNTGVGWYSLFSNSTASYNTGVGAGTLALNGADLNTAIGAAALLLNTTGAGNTAVGTDALLYNESGSDNNAVGAFALFKNIDGAGNNAFGGSALSQNVHGALNTAIGDGALFNNDITGASLANFNTAVGGFALYFNTDGDSNSAVGYGALENNDTGSNNTALGTQALFSNTEGEANTAVGYTALQGNIIGFANTAVGHEALTINSGNTGATGNTGIGYRALAQNTTGNDNVAVGALALDHSTIGSQNIALGTGAGANLSTGNGNIEIGNVGNAADAFTIRIGNIFHERTFIGGIRGVTTGMANAIPVMIDSQDQLGTISSSRRYKKDIQPMEQASEVIHALKPVTFRYKTDSTGTPQFGLIAEEVAEANPDLVVRDENGEIYSVRYDAVNAMLLNEFLKEHRKVEKQQAAIAQLKSVIAQQQKEFRAAMAEQRKAAEKIVARLEQQDAKIRMVNDRIELTKSAHQAIATNE
jgi:hypothetical protein